MSWFNQPAPVPTRPPREQHAASPSYAPPRLPMQQQQPPPQQISRRPVPSAYDPPPPQSASSSQYQYEKRPPPPSIRSAPTNHFGGRFSVVEAPSASHALTNCLIVNESDWGGVPYVTLKGARGSFLFTTKLVSPFPHLSPERH